MRRIVIIAASMAGVVCAARVKTLCPKEEIIVILPAEAKKAPPIMGVGPVRRRMYDAQAPLRAPERHDMAILEAHDIKLDTDENEVSILSGQGRIGIRYTDLAVEVTAKARIPRSLQQAKNIVACPFDDFSAQALMCDSLFKKAADEQVPILIIGNEMAAFEALFLAHEAKAPVLWGHHLGSFPLEPHLTSYIQSCLSPTVQSITLPQSTSLDALAFDATTKQVTGVKDTEGTIHAVAGCLLATSFMAAHPILRETGVTLNENGGIVKDETAPENITLFGSGIEIPPFSNEYGISACAYSLGSQQTALTSAVHTATKLAGSTLPLHTVWGTAGAKTHGMALFRAGMTEAEARSLELDADHSTMAVPLEWLSAPSIAPLLVRHDFKDPPALWLTLIANKQNSLLLGVQIFGHNGAESAAEGLFTTLLHAIRNHLTLQELAQQDLCGGQSALVHRCADALLQKFCGTILGITPEEFIASRDAGADFFFLDVQDSEAWQKKHIPDAYNIPLHQLKKRAQGEIPRLVPLVIASTTSDEAIAAASLLHTFGATDLYILDGGISLWPFAYEQGTAK